MDIRYIGSGGSDECFRAVYVHHENRRLGQTLGRLRQHEAVTLVQLTLYFFGHLTLK